MVTRTISAASLLLASIGAVALSTGPAQAQFNAPVPYTQCVKNVIGDSGIAARVKWYNANEVEFVKPDPRGDNANTTDIDESLGQLKVGFAKPVQEKVVLVAQENCVGGIKGITPPKIAIISVVGGKFANEAISIAAKTLAAGVGLISCPVTAGVGCAAAVAIAAGTADAAVSLAVLGVPEAKSVFYIGFPGQLELKGTAFNPAAVDKTVGTAVLPYKAWVDYCISGLKDTTSANKITVDFMAGSTLVQRQMIDASAGCSKQVEISTAQVVTSVRINTNGGDAMLIDQVQVERDGRRIFWDGRENGGGYCLSTDVNDHIGGWETASSGCKKSISFSNPG